jgi:hypothetical protein
MRLTGHTESMRYMRNAYKIFVGYLVREKIGVEKRTVLKMGWKKEGMHL